MRVSSSINLLLKHLRVERGPAVVMFVVVLVASFLVAAVPRFYTQLLDNELLARIENAPAVQRNIALRIEGRLQITGSDLLRRRLESNATSYLAGLSPELRNVISDHRYVLSFPEVSILMNTTSPEPEYARNLRLRYHSDVDQHIEYVAGQPPAGHRPVEVSGLSAIFGDPDHDTILLSVTEVALSQSTADALSLDVGDLAVVSSLGNGMPFAIYVSGTFEVQDPEAVFWNNDPWLASPVRLGSQDDEITVGTALVSLDGYAGLFRLTEATDFSAALPFEYRWIYSVDPAALNTGNYEAVVAEVRKLQVALGPYETLMATRHQDVSVLSGLGNIQDRFRADSRYSLAIVAVITISIVVIALVSIAVLATLIADRSTERSALIRGRGASSGQVATGRVVEGLLICIPAGFLGWCLAQILVDGRNSQLSLLLPLSTIGLTVFVLLLANRRNLFTDLGELLGRRSVVPVITEQRRIVIELFAVGMAIGGIVVLRRRGLAPSGEAELDPMLAAVPVLLMLAVGVVVMRLHPLLMSGTARLVRRRTDVVPFVALRSAAARPPSAHLPLLVMVLAIGVASFALVTWRSVDAIQWGSVWILDDTGQYVETFNPADGASPPSPLAEGVRRSLMLGSIIAMAHAVLAILIALILGAAARRREVGFLRTIGLSSRQTAALTAFEYLPMLILACPAGLVFGVVAARLVESTMDLGAATGSEAPVSIAIPWLEIALIPAILALTVGLVVFAFTFVARRTQLTALTRIGDR